MASPHCSITSPWDHPTTASPRYGITRSESPSGRCLGFPALRWDTLSSTNPPCRAGNLGRADGWGRQTGGRRGCSYCRCSAHPWPYPGAPVGAAEAAQGGHLPFPPSAWGRPQAPRTRGWVRPEGFGLLRIPPGPHTQLPAGCLGPGAEKPLHSCFPPTGILSFPGISLLAGPGYSLGREMEDLKQKWIFLPSLVLGTPRPCPVQHIPGSAVGRGGSCRPPATAPETDVPGPDNRER